MNQIFRPARLFGSITMVMLGCWAGLAVAQVLARVLRIRAIDGVAAGDVEAFLRLETSDSHVTFTSLGLGVLTMAAAVPFCVWLFQARTNAAQITDAHRWGRLWVIFGWFVPIVNLWIPRQLIADVWSASAGRGEDARSLAVGEAAWQDDSGPWPGADRPRHARRPWLVSIWWTVWLMYVLGGRLVSAVQADGHRLESTVTLAAARDRDMAMIYVTVIGAAAAILAALIVWRINRMQQAQADHLAAVMGSA